MDESNGIQGKIAKLRSLATPSLPPTSIASPERATDSDLIVFLFLLLRKIEF